MHTKGWESLTEEFNSRAGVKKQDWENMDLRGKKGIAKANREVKLTGSGTASAEKDECAIAVAVVQIIPAQMTSLENPVDDDNYVPGKRIATKQNIVIWSGRNNKNGVSLAMYYIAMFMTQALQENS